MCVCVQTPTINFDSLSPPPKKKKKNHWKAEEISFMSHNLLPEKHLFTFIHIFKKSSKSITAYPFALAGTLCL